MSISSHGPGNTSAREIKIELDTKIRDKNDSKELTVSRRV